MIIYAILLLVILLVLGSLNSQIKCNDFLRMENIDQLKTGDLIFGRHRNFASRLQQWALASPVNHIAMIVKIEEELWVWDVDPKIGAYLTTFKDYVQSNFDGTHKKPAIPASFYGLDVPYVVPRGVYSKTALYIKRLQKPIDQMKTLDFIEKNLGRPFSFRFWCAAVSQTILFDLPCGIIKESEGVFCSELLFSLFLELGAVSPRSPRTVLPVHFWEDSVHWQNNYALKPQQLIGSIKNDILESSVAEKLVNIVIRST